MAQPSSTLWPRREVTKDRPRLINGLEIRYPPAPARSRCSTPAAKSLLTAWSSVRARAVRALTGLLPVPRSPLSKATKARVVASWWCPAQAEVVPDEALRLQARPTGALASHTTAPTLTTTAPISSCRLPHPGHPTKNLSKNACGRESDVNSSSHPGQPRLCLNNIER